MTCREKLMKERPGDVGECWLGGCIGCPDDHDYLDRPEYCNGSGDDALCTKCWDREIPKTGEPRILDSGERREFGTGAVRDIQEGKGRCDLMPLDVIAWMLGAYDDPDFVLGSIHRFMTDGDWALLYDALEFFRNLLGVDYPSMFLDVAKHFEEGAKKYGEYNWQKGIPVHCYIDSAVRHYLKYLRGDNDEPHDRAFVWNILCCIWTCKHKPELIDLPFVQNNKERED